MSKYVHKHFPETKEQLQKLVDDESICLGEINTSLITDMSWLFYNSKRTNFNGIETWDTSNVTDMNHMFAYCENFNQNLNNWDVSNVEDMDFMFAWCKNFNQNITDWNVSNVKRMRYMFFECIRFNQDLSKWNINDNCNIEDIFLAYNNFQKDYKPKVLQKENLLPNM